MWSTEAFRLLSQGATADVHGFTFRAPGRNLGKGRATEWGLPLRGVQSTRNTPDFMLEPFIVHPTDDTRWTPPIGGWSLTVIAIQLCTQG